MTYSVVMTARASNDVDVIVDYIAERNPAGAQRWFDAFRSARDALRTDPQRHARAPESGRYLSELRQVLFKTRHGNRYRILYAIEGEQVLIMHVRGQGQDLVG